MADFDGWNQRPHCGEHLHENNGFKDEMAAFDMDFNLV